MNTSPRQSKSRSRAESGDDPPSRAPRRVKGAPIAKKTRKSVTDAQATLDAIRAGQIDALVIRGGDSEKLYALRSFAEIEQTRAALETAGAESTRTRAQLQALAEERERLFQDMHDGCIQSIYAVGLNLEACLRVIDVSPKRAGEMIADATASLNLVIQELRAFITGRKLQIAAGQDLRSEIEKAAQAAGHHGLTFSVDIDEGAMQALTSEQALHILQIAREGISNATRHANAGKGRVSLQRRKGSVRLEVSDNGSGFVVGKLTKHGLGLHHIEARARKMGGTSRVSSAPNKGTRIIIELGKPR